MNHRKIFYLLLIPFMFSGCAATVKVEAPEKPIEINMNVNIKHEIRIKVEKDIDNLITNNKGLF